MAVIDINENKEHCVSEVACLNCKHRWIAVFDEETLLKELECPECHKVGYVIKTGQDISCEAAVWSNW